jgi:multiple sugar transport system substrate-binding protein
MEETLFSASPKLTERRNQCGYYARSSVSDRAFLCDTRYRRADHRRSRNFTSDEAAIVEVAPFLKDPKYPYWDPDQFLPAIKRLYTWQGKLYGVLLDADAQILYYRKDVLGNQDYQEKFKSKLGYDLPNPPKTMQEMHDVASFFTGWDWNGDGKDDWGISLHAKVNQQGFFHFLTLAAPYVISPSNKYFYFNPEDMKPLINSEGHLRALEEYVKFLANGPSEQIGWTLEQGWSPFLSGHAVMEPTWGDLPTLAQNRAHSSVQGRVGATIIPGTTDSFNPLISQWEKSMLNTVGNTNGGSWHCVISRLSKQKEAAYDFLAFMANKKNAFFNVTNGWTGVQPGMKYYYFAPVGTGRVEEWENQGWDEDDAIVYLNAYYANLILPAQQIYLQIPGGAEYWHELDVRISSVLSGATKAKRSSRRYPSSMGADHRWLRPREPKKTLRRVVRRVVTNRGKATTSIRHSWLVDTLTDQERPVPNRM